MAATDRIPAALAKRFLPSLSQPFFNQIRVQCCQCQQPDQEDLSELETRLVCLADWLLCVPRIPESQVLLILQQIEDFFRKGVLAHAFFTLADGYLATWTGYGHFLNLQTALTEPEKFKHNAVYTLTYRFDAARELFGKRLQHAQTQRG